VAAGAAKGLDELYSCGTRRAVTLSIRLSKEITRGGTIDAKNRSSDGPDAPAGRINRRTSRSRGKLFYRLAQQMMAVDPLPQTKLHGGKSDQITTT